MINFQKLPKITVACYCLSITLIGFIMAEQFLEWQLLDKETKITLLVIAAIIGVTGSIVSIGKQIAGFLKKEK